MSYIENYTDDQTGDLYLKYFLADESLTRHPNNPESDFSLDLSRIRDSIGKYFTKQIPPELSYTRDGHPWAHSPKATYQDHLNFAKQIADGVIVDLSERSDSALRSASGQAAIKNRGIFATVKITDPSTRDKFRKNPNLIPKFVSIGIIDNENGKSQHVKDYNVVHLAPVVVGAYGDKATHYGSCFGGNECIDHLKGAGIISSLGIFSPPNSDLIVSTDPTNNINTSQGAVNNANTNVNSSPQLETNTNNQTSAPIQNNTTGSPVLRLKTQSAQTQGLQGQQQQAVRSIQNDPEFLKMREQLEKVQALQEIEQKKQEYRQYIPKELFILNGKFDESGYEKELNKVVERGWGPEDIQEFYQTKLQLLIAGNGNGLQVGQIGKPYGASANVSKCSKTYQTPSDVPEQNQLKGASAGSDSSQFAGIKNLCNMFGLTGGAN